MDKTGRNGLRIGDIESDNFEQTSLMNLQKNINTYQKNIIAFY